MPAIPTTAAAAQLLTTLAMRPDLATRMTDLHFRLQADYERLLALRRQRSMLAEALDECDASLSSLASNVCNRVTVARLALRDYTVAGPAQPLAAKVA
ncbi:MAG TPA: hypothetical protein DIU15_12565 [Deltaproteobacteria bacterium]|nr:hypothetical protein [Deltaproteobacteria bacterium]HCP46871.1 hypothetical protein [Deltaproteobacteria bacterium]